LIPKHTEISMPEFNTNKAEIPENIKRRAGIYDAGPFGGMMNIEFTNDSLILKPLAARNERSQEYVYNTEGKFVSTNGDYMGKTDDTAYGISQLDFNGNYLVMQTYTDVPTLGQSVMAMPIAEKLADNPISDATKNIWQNRNEKEFLLVSEKYTSLQYVLSPILKTSTDERASGYVISDIFRNARKTFPTVKIINDNSADCFLITPTMPGRDGKNLNYGIIGGVEYLNFNYGNYFYMDASAAEKFSEQSNTITINDKTVWIDVDDESAGKIIHIDAPQNGAWFAYDEKMNCITTSLEKNCLADTGSFLTLGMYEIWFTRILKYPNIKKEPRNKT